MDRLISEKAIVDVLRKGYWDKNLQSAKDDPCVIDAMIDWAIRQIKAIPSAEPYKGMTNGEVLKVVFPHEDVYKGEFGYDLGGCTIDFDWWNSPYEPQERSENAKFIL